MYFIFIYNNSNIIFNTEQTTLSKIVISRIFSTKNHPLSSCIIIFDTPSRIYNSNEIQNSFNDTGTSADR